MLNYLLHRNNRQTRRMFKKVFKAAVMQKRKPTLNIKPNHKSEYESREMPIQGRVWHSKQYGTAVRDGDGWYKPMQKRR